MTPDATPTASASGEATTQLPVVVVCSAREKTRDVMRKAFSRRRSRLSLVRHPADLDAALRRTLADAVIVDMMQPTEETWRAAGLARELPSIPFFAYTAPRPADTAVSARCASLEFADLLAEGIDEPALRELVVPRGFTARFLGALGEAHVELELAASLQQQAWRFVVGAGGRPVRTDEIADALGVTREHLSRSFSADGAPNLKRVIDLVRLLAAAELAKNSLYDLADVSAILEFASPSHLANTAQRVAGIRAASLTRLRPQDLFARFRQGRSRSRD